MKSLGVIAAIGAALYGLYLVLFPSVAVRYRLELLAEVDGKPVSGASVIEVRYAERIPWLSIYSGGITIDVKGEAVVVDLGARGMLFALLKAGEHIRSGPDYIVPLAFGVSSGGIGPEHFAQLRDLTGRRKLPFDNLPLLVRFSDIADPRTVQRVSPYDLAASFGPGVALKGATIEITSLGWWPLNIFGVTGQAITHTIEAKAPILIHRLRQEAKRSRPYDWREPYVARLGQFERSK